jgi:beta-fructofuranosidase
LAEDGRVIAMYHGRELGNMCATSHDPLLLNWEKVTGTTVIPLNKDGQRFHFLSHEPLPYRIYDACIWKKGGMYYSLSGSVSYEGPQGKPMLAEFLFRSRDLAHWDFVHDFVRGNRFTQPGDDGACPYFWPIGGRHILIFFSHTSSAQYLLGDYDQEHDTFSAGAHGRFCFGPVLPGAVQAPSAAPDGKGGVIAIFNMNGGRPGQRDDGLMTLPRRLTLEGTEDLRQEPAGDVESLRGEHVHLEPMTLPANHEMVLPEVRGNALELQAEIDPAHAQSVELNVLRSANAEETTRITFYKDRQVTSRFMPPQKKLGVISIDNARSSLLPEAHSRPPETASVYIAPEEPLKLRVFVDRSVVEVFVNGRQAVAVRVYPSREDSVGVSLRAQGAEAKVRALDAWQMRGIF